MVGLTINMVKLTIFFLRAVNGRILTQDSRKLTFNIMGSKEHLRGLI